jgi:hypothetical protein
VDHEERLAEKRLCEGLGLRPVARDDQPPAVGRVDRNFFEFVEISNLDLID